MKKLEGWRARLRFGAGVAMAMAAATAITNFVDAPNKPNPTYGDCHSRLDNFELAPHGKIHILGMTASAPCTNIYDAASGIEDGHLNAGATVNACVNSSKPDELRLFNNRFTARPGYVELSEHAWRQVSAAHLGACAIMPSNF